MRIRPLLSVAAVTAIAASLVGAPGVLAGSGTTRYVDGDGKAGPAGCNASTTAKKTIQGAVDASGPGDTILVCPGVYQEQVIVAGADGLTIKGIKPWTAQVLSPEQLDAPFLLMVVDSHDVTVQWLRFTSLATQPDTIAGAADCGQVEAAVAVVASTGATVRSNRIDAQGRHTLGACGFTVGVVVGDMATGTAVASSPAGETPVFHKVTAKVVNNLVRDFQTAGIATMGLRTTVDVVQNSLQFRHEDDPFGCDTPASASAVAPRKADRLRSLLSGLSPAGPGIPMNGDCFAFGVLDFAGTNGTVRYNEIWSAATTDFMPAGNRAPAYLLAGIAEFIQGAAVQEFTSGDLPAQSDAPVVRGNRIRGAIAGIALVGGDLVAVRDNIVRKALAGVFVGGTHDARVSNNALREAFVGIWVNDDILNITGRDSMDSVISGNDIPGSQYMEVSCMDDTVGDGSQGTDNTWTDNDAPANSSDPIGICGANI